MTDAVSEIIKQARVILEERTPSTKATRQAVNLIAKAPRLDKREIGSMKFTAAMALRGHCTMYRSVPAVARQIILSLIQRDVALLEALESTPADTAYQRWLLE